MIIYVLSSAGTSDKQLCLFFIQEDKLGLRLLIAQLTPRPAKSASKAKRCAVPS